MGENISPIEKLNSDIRSAAKELSAQEARYMVDAYYTMQDHRMATGNQVRTLFDAGEPNETIKYFHKQYRGLEMNIQKILDAYTKQHPVGQWMRGIMGVGPVIAAGLLAHIDITKAPTVGHIWSFAGLNAEAVWLSREKSNALAKEIIGNSKKITNKHIVELGNAVGRKPESILRLATDDGKKKLTRQNLTAALAKRPWNARLKVICWKLGESFVKVSANPKDIYGHIYAERKRLEIERNEAGLFADQAAAALKNKNIGKDTEAYKWYSKGMLPPAHIHARAKRYAVKLFLSHLHEFWYEHEYGEKPPLPYPIAFLGHAHKIERPA